MHEVLGRARTADDPHVRPNRSITLLLLLIAAGPAPTVPAGNWEIASTIAQLDVAGVPGFLQRMAKGHTTVERKCLPVGQSVAALLAPDPKAQCRVDQVTIANGHYAQVLTCPQKQGGPITVTRSGSYNGSGFTGQASVTGSTRKGPMSITLDQRATHGTGACSS